MGRVIQFEDHALARLRERCAAAEEANQDLLAFARGHSGAVSSIHSAVLSAMEADSFDSLLHVVTQEWPLMLGIDAVALALIVGERGFRVDSGGVQLVDPQMLQRSLRQVDGVVLRSVDRGHPLFGPACDLIRAEALIRLESDAPVGLIALGQRAGQQLDGRHGSELLLFLGRSLSAMIQRWTLNP
ncbi:DUF484 family protein [Sphingomonas sp. GCM10030256]|uniref:DUF484 family protein n=1 Tax=Sphingomonas sp. GCM10030256 TaxID=3273427 RepID=UPI00361DA2F9